MKQEELAPLVDQLRQGNEAVKATIIANHMRLAMAIVAKYTGRYPYLIDDMVGAAMMGICQAVDWAPTRLYDNNITPYIYQTVERHIRDLIETRFVINIPRKTFKTLYEEEGAFLPIVQTIHSTKFDEDNPHDDYDLLDEIALKRVEEYPMFFEELLESLALTARERMIIDLLIEDYNQTEIAQLIGVSSERVRQIRMEIGTRLKKRVHVIADYIEGTTQEEVDEDNRLDAEIDEEIAQIRKENPCIGITELSQKLLTGTQ